MTAPLVVYPFRYKDARTGRWVKARYMAARDEIAARYEGTHDLGAHALLRGRRFEPVRDLGPLLEERLPNRNGFLAHDILRRLEVGHTRELVIGEVGDGRHGVHALDRPARATQGRASRLRRKPSPHFGPAAKSMSSGLCMAVSNRHRSNRPPRVPSLMYRCPASHERAASAGRRRRRDVARAPHHVGTLTAQPFVLILGATPDDDLDVGARASHPLYRRVIEP